MSRKLDPFMDGMKKALEEFVDNASNLKKEVEELEELQLQRLAEKVKLEESDIDTDGFKKFIRKPYLINPKDKKTYEIIVPKFIDFQVGRLDRQVHNYNVFVIDKYTKWMTGVPDFLEEEIELDSKQNFKIYEDLLKFDSERKDVLDDYRIRKHVTNVEDDRATIKKGHEFELIAELIERGELPYTPQPVKDNDMREPEFETELGEGIEGLRSFQKEGYNEFLKRGHACFCWITGGGKSFPAMLALDSLKYDENESKKAVVVYGKATEDQWHEYFDMYAPRLEEEVEVVTYQSMDKLEGKYILIVFDECHALPAPTFSKGATIPTKYRLGLSASPYREDGKTNYIFALTGIPLGLDWKETLDIMGKEYHEVNIHTVENRREKVKRIRRILERNPDKNTIVFCDGLDFGEKLSKETGLRFVSGKDRNQLEKIRADDRVIVSRIGDHGISLKGLQMILEADFLYGSRRQQIQRTGRLFHGEGERHDIFFTHGEFNRYKKRLFSLIEKGFKLNFVDQQKEIEIPDKYRNRIELNLGGEEIGDEIPSSPESLSGVGVLKHDKVQELIRERINDYDRVKNKDLKEAIIAVATSEEGLTNSQVEDLFQSDRSAYRYFTPFKKVGLVEKRGDRWRLNTENIMDVIEKHEETKKRREEVEEIKKELEV